MRLQQGSVVSLFEKLPPAKSCSFRGNEHYAVVDGVEAAFTQTNLSQVLFFVLPRWMDIVEGEEC